MATGTRILVCRTCPRFVPNPRHDRTDGAALGAEIAALAVANGWNPGDVRMVNCLAGCKNPCNIALDGDSKYRLRFSLLGPGVGRDVIKAAQQHGKSTNGDIPKAELPEKLRCRLSAKSPPRIGD